MQGVPPGRRPRHLGAGEAGGPIGPGGPPSPRRPAPPRAPSWWPGPGRWPPPGTALAGGRRWGTESPWGGIHVMSHTLQVAVVVLLFPFHKKNNNLLHGSLLSLFYPEFPKWRLGKAFGTSDHKVTPSCSFICLRNSQAAVSAKTPL